MTNTTLRLRGDGVPAYFIDDLGLNWITVSM